jgi:hypothetical protein
MSLYCRELLTILLWNGVLLTTPSTCDAKV